MKKSTLLKWISAIAIIASVAAIVIKKLSFNKDILFDAILVGVLAIVLIAVLFSIEALIRQRYKEVEEGINSNIKDIISEGMIGLLTYDDDFEITWMSSLFVERGLDYTGEKLLSWIPEIERLLKMDHATETIIIGDNKYRVSKKENSNTLLFKDITKEYDLKQKADADAYVLGLVSYDNYDEASESEEDISYINSNIKTPVIDYFKSFNIEYKTLRNNRLLLILNEKQFNSLLEDRFSILNTVRNESKKGDLMITLSMAFARGSEDLIELDNLASELLEIAQTRGGDQVVARVVGQEAIFYGGSSEAREKQSKVKVRVIANTLKDLIEQASNVVVVCHTDSDSDCIGSAICMSTIIQSLKKQAYIVIKDDSIESMISDALKQSSKELSRHNFVNENEAYNLMNNESLVIMVDHHMASQSNAKEILNEAKHIVIIDHHRRNADLDVQPMLVYIEAGASSTCELVCEFLPYLTRRSPLSSTEANLIYLGMIIDTNHFRNRTGSRTFEVARMLREAGADPLLCEKISQEPYEKVKLRAEIVNNGKRYEQGIIISSMLEGVYPRSIASQACDSLISTKEINASFVICNIAKDEVCVTARSNGSINVQKIMEVMKGGGHMTAAGLQRKDTSVIEVENELKEVIFDYLKKEA